jgi:glycosyltransferase involved in cell wall biosynthesis
VLVTKTHVESITAQNGRHAAARPLLSVVVPAHDEGGVIGATLARIAAVVRPGSALEGRIEVIVVSDGSTDGTFKEACRALGPALPGTVVELVANAGSHAAIRCGLRYASGDCVAIMAADGQDPPEALPAMIRASRALDIVWGRRRDRANDRPGARRAATAYYRIFRMLTGLDYPPSGLDFVLVRRRVIDAVLQRSTRNISIFLLIYNLGFAQGFVDYERGARGGGQSSWTLRKRIKLAIDMLTSFSAAPIRVASVAGLLAGAMGIGLGGVTLLRAALGDIPVSGWASLMVVSSLTSGLMLVAIAFLGEYVWRILDEVRGAPLFIEARHERVAGAAPQEDT